MFTTLDSTVVDTSGTDDMATRIKFRFPNGRGCSVIRGPYTYGGPSGLWEVAILDDNGIDYTTPLTDDVIGYCSEERVDEIIATVAGYPPVGTEIPASSDNYVMGMI